MGNDERKEGETSSQLAVLIADVEKLKAESVANGEIRKISNERFTQISEQIGELRSMINQAERARQELEIKAEKAAGLVETVQPEKLMIEVNKVDFKVEALKSKLEANELINSKIKEDLRELRNKFAVFRNLEMVKGLNEDSKKRFRDLRRIEVEVIKHSDKVDSLFNEIDGTLKESKDASKGVKDLSDSLRKLITEVDNVKSGLKVKPSKEELSKLDKRIDGNNNHVMDLVHKELEEYKGKILKDIEVAARKQELGIIKEMVRKDFEKVSDGLIDFKNHYEKVYKKEMDNEKKIDVLTEVIKVLSVKDGRGISKRGKLEHK